MAAMTSYFENDPRTARERMLAGDPYIADAHLHAQYMRALRLSREYERAYLAEDGTADAVLRELLGSVGEGVHIRPPLTVDYGYNIHIGEGTFINFGLVALDPVEIRIGKYCQIATHVQLLTPTHPIEPEPRKHGIEAAKKIVIGDNVWLGGGVIVCPGVTIGDNSVIGAGAVLTRSIPANVVAVGNPARVIRTVDGAGEHDA